MNIKIINMFLVEEFKIISILLVKSFRLSGYGNIVILLKFNNFICMTCKCGNIVILLSKFNNFICMTCNFL
jgi:hypothetical protein